VISSRVNPPYWRLSGFYFFYFASLGVIMPYWGLYLQSIGFSALEIGELLAILMATKMVAPYLWAWLADYSLRRVKIIQFGSLGAAASFLGVFWGEGYIWVALVMLLFSFFWNATLPQFETVTLNHLGDQSHQYSYIRLWGSIGFVLVVSAVGPFLEQFGVSYVPVIIFVILAIIWLLSLLTPEANSKLSSSDSVSLLTVLAQPHVIVLFSICFLMQASHGPYYAFYSIFLEESGYSRSLIGQLWALGVVAEIIVFLFMRQLLQKFDAKHLLMVCFVFAGIRWLLIGYCIEYLSIIIVAQLLHAASFGMYHAVVIHLVHTWFAGGLQGRGQALYSSVSFGAGGVAGALFSGYLWSDKGASFVFTVSTIFCMVGLILTVKSLKYR